MSLVDKPIPLEDGSALVVRVPIAEVVRLELYPAGAVLPSHASMRLHTARQLVNRLRSAIRQAERTALIENVSEAACSNS